MIYGMDVSHWNTMIDWKLVARSGVRFAYLKASEGLTYIDPAFEINLKGARAAGILVGAYHYFRPNLDPLRQADWFFATAAGTCDLPPAMDLEEDANLPRQRIAEAARAALSRTAEVWQCKAALYTSPGFWTEHLPPLQDWALDYSLWQATYSQYWPATMYPWAGWNFWQYTARARLPGVSTNVDLDRFNGSYAELTALKGGL